MKKRRRVGLSRAGRGGPPPVEPAADSGRRAIGDELSGADQPVGEKHTHGAAPGFADLPLAEDVASSEPGQVVLLAGARAEGRGMLVRAPRTGCEGAAATGAHEPEHEIDVLPVREEALVEGARIASSHR